MQLSAITSPLQYSQHGALGAQKQIDKTQQSSEEQASKNSSRQSGSRELTEADNRRIAQLQKMDREVRAHEAAHISASGGLVRGGASFSYVQGPDGKRYAVSGEVSIDTSPVHGDPHATLLKAQRIQSAALAPAQPSNADRAVAASAAQMAAMARAELLAERLSPEESETEKTDQLDTDSIEDMNGSQTIDNRTSAELGQLIKQATSTENRLGNLLDTAV